MTRSRTGFQEDIFWSMFCTISLGPRNAAATRSMLFRTCTSRASTALDAFCTASGEVARATSFMLRCMRTRSPSTIRIACVTAMGCRYSFSVLSANTRI